MTKHLISCLLLSLFISLYTEGQTVKTNPKETPRIVNIINFIRQTEPRPRGITDEVLYQTIVEEIHCMHQHKLKGTFLLQYDALINPKYQQLLKKEMSLGSEVGAWWEITQPHVEAAGMKWRGRYSWDWYANVGFATGYTPKEREKLVDVYMSKFKEIYGKYPTSVGSWFIDAHTLAYFYDKYHIIASCNCRDQVGTDGYTLWGGYWGQGYYPSRKNMYMPAQTMKEQINVPVFRMLGSDPIYQYDCGVGGKAQDAFTLEPVYKNAGGSSQWTSWFFQSLFESPCMGFTYTQAGQENSFTWSKIQKGFEMQMPLLEQYMNKHLIKIQTLSETGKWYKARYSMTPATALTALSDYRSDNKKTVWYNSRFYRANLLWEGQTFRIRDIHLFNENYPSEYLNKPTTSSSVVFTTLPFVDGCLWSSNEKMAGLRLKYKDASGKYTEAQGGTPNVRTSGNELVVNWILKNGATLKIFFTEGKMNISCTSKSHPLNWYLELTALPEAQLPFTTIGSHVIKATQKQFNYWISQAGKTIPSVLQTTQEPFDYQVMCIKGRFLDMRKSADGSVFRIIPTNQTIILDLKDTSHR